MPQKTLVRLREQDLVRKAPWCRVCLAIVCTPSVDFIQQDIKVYEF